MSPQPTTYPTRRTLHITFFQTIDARRAALITAALATLLFPTGAQAAPVSLLCGFDTSFGDGTDTAYPRRSESRVLIDFEKKSVRFTSPGSGQMLVPNEASISKSYIRWWVGTRDGMQKQSYSIERASGTYTARLTFGGEVQSGGSRGSCLPKKAF